MSIIGNALAGGLSAGMQTYAGQMQAEQSLEARRQELAAKLKADRDEFLMRLAATAAENKLNRDSVAENERTKAAANVEAKKIEKASQFEARPDLYGANATPVDRAKFEKESSTFSRTDDSEYSDAVSRRTAPLVETKTKTFDADGYKRAEDERIDTNIRRKGRVDAPQYADDLEKGVGRGIVNDLLRQSPQGPDAAAASLTVEGKNRFDVKGNTVVDLATGKDRATDVGDSLITKNERPPVAKGGGSGRGAEASRVHKIITNGEGKAVAVMKDGSERVLGSSGETNKEIAKIITKKSNDDFTFQRMPVDEQRRIATEILLGKPTSQGDNAVPTPTTKADYDKLPRGARYKAPDGKIRTKG